MRHRLPNGLTVLIEEHHNAPVVALQAWVHVGSADEAPDEAGLAHVHEHMIFKGTARRGVGEIARDVEASGGEINAWTSYDETVYYVVMSSRYFAQGLDVLADAMTGATFDPHELEREIEVILEEIRRHNDTPASVISQALFSAAYQNHPYRLPILGQVRTVRGFDRDKVMHFYRRHYRPENMTLIVVGDVDAREALGSIEAAFARFAPAPPAGGDNGNGHARAPAPAHAAGRRAEAAQRRIRVRVMEKDVQEAHVQLGWHIPDLKHPDIAALDVLSVILGHGESSRYAESLRHRTSVTSDVWGYAFTPRDPGLYIAGATCAPGKTREALSGLVRETARVAADGVAEREVDKARLIIEADHVMQRQTVQGLARKLGFYQVAAGDLDFEKAYLNGIARVRGEDVQRVARDHLTAQNLTVACLAPRAGARRRAVDGAAVQKVVAAAMDAREKRRAPAVVRGREGARREPRVEQRTLECGMRVFVQEDPIVPLVSLRAVVLGGQRYESDADNGINTLLSRTVTRGTRTRSGEEVAREIESMAGHMEAFAGRNSFGFALDILSRHFDRGLATLVECMLEPALAEDVVGRERDVLLEDIRARDDNPSGLAFDLFSSHLFRRHPYRLPGLGTEMSVRVLTRDPLVRYYRRYCRPASMVVAVVGDVRAEDVFARLTRVFSGQPATPTRPPRIQSEPPLEGIREAVLAREKEQAHFVLGFPGIALTDRDRPAMQLLSAVLGGQGGRLFVELRDRQSLAYSVGAFSYEGVEPGYFAVYMAGAPEKRDQAVRGMLAELEKVAAQGVGEDELARARLYIVGSHDISLQRPASRATTIAFNELYGLGWREMIDLPRRVTSVKASDVRRVARRYLTVGREARYVLAQVMPAPAVPATT